MNELRQSVMLDTDLMGSKRRFGLFSQPPSTAIGDDSPYRSKHARKGEDGKPTTLPRNMLPGPNRSGVGKKSFIHLPDSIYKGDKYLDPQKIEHHYNIKLHSKSPIHEIEFKPADGQKSQSEFPYQHIDENPLPKIRPERDSTGRVISKDRNFTTNPTSKVDHQVFKPYKYIIDPLQRKQMMESQEKKQAKQKMLPELFRSMSHGDILFTKDKKTYGIDNKTQQLLKKKHSFAISNPVKVPHEGDWKPARRGHGDPIGKFPQFIIPKSVQLHKSDLPNKSKRQPQQQQRELWKHNGNKSLSRPTPSISYSSINLRKYL